MWEETEKARIVQIFAIRVITCCGGVNKMEPDIIVVSSDRIRGDGHKLKYKKFL